MAFKDKLKAAGKAFREKEAAFQKASMERQKRALAREKERLKLDRVKAQRLKQQAMIAKQRESMRKTKESTSYFGAASKGVNPIGSLEQSFGKSSPDVQPPKPKRAKSGRSITIKFD